MGRRNRGSNMLGPTTRCRAAADAGGSTACGGPASV